MNAPNDQLIKEARYECPFCNEPHDVQIRKRITKALVKKEPVEYEQTYYYCPNEDEEFVPEKIMNENLLKARDAYRKNKDLLTSGDIKAIRKVYDLRQKEFSNLLGWGDVTIQRYETKLIQDETYDNIIRMVAVNPLFGLELLDKHKEDFGRDRYTEIRQVFKNKIKEKGNYLLKLQEIKNWYIDYEEESDLNGYKKLDLEKLNRMLGYFAHFIRPLYKVKLMKLLWYSDAFNFKNSGKSMTGLVYQHFPMGAVPVAYNEILSLPAIQVEEEYINDYIAYQINPGEEVNISSFSFDEFNILQRVTNFFKDKKTHEVVEYMHGEIAYRETEPKQVIPYSLAKHVRELGF
jgi:putative zinc finger/helix-turn-helix YgiT family protein